MTQVYSDPDRTDDPHALPNMEVFYKSKEDFLEEKDGWLATIMQEFNEPEEGVAYTDAAKELEGWYWWACFPGCLADGPPTGPFKTEDEAKINCMDGYL